MRYIVISGVRYDWKEIRRLRREQIQAARQRQLPLFECGTIRAPHHRPLPADGTKARCSSRNSDMRIMVKPVLNALGYDKKGEMLRLAVERIPQARYCGPYIVDAFDMDGQQYFFHVEDGVMSIGLTDLDDGEYEPLT